jgi:methanethiol S-methyltransferase
LLGLIIMIVAIRNYDWKSFIGITEEKNYSLVIAGMNRYVRHPLYSGTMIFVMGYFIWQPYFKNLILMILMWVYLAIGIIYEERKLVKLYGDVYKNYQKKVKKMIPFIW